MSSTSPAVAASQRPHTDSVFKAHFKASIGLAVYLIVGGALAVVGLMSVGYAEKFSGTLATLPYMIMFAMVMWFGMGAWLLSHHDRHVQDTTRTYEDHAQRQSVTQRAPAQHTSEPWELRAFWGNQPSTQRALPNSSTTRSATTTRPASVVRRHVTRPISLFGAYQDTAVRYKSA